MDDLVEIRYINGGETWVVVTRLLATGMVGIEVREIEKKGSSLKLININNFDTAVKERICVWKRDDYGSYGCSSYEYRTTCGVNFDCNEVTKMNYCPNCGGKL
jgi:hypothetical protein